MRAEPKTVMGTQRAGWMKWGMSGMAPECDSGTFENMSVIPQGTAEGGAPANLKWLQGCQCNLQDFYKQGANMRPGLVVRALHH